VRPEALDIAPVGVVRGRLDGQLDVSLQPLAQVLTGLLRFADQGSLYLSSVVLTYGHI
jgi:hypothetical protein